MFRRGLHYGIDQNDESVLVFAINRSAMAVPYRRKGVSINRKLISANVMMSKVAVNIQGSVQLESKTVPGGAFRNQISRVA